MTQRKREVSAELAIRVMKRDRFSCTYCGVSGQDAELQIDHIIPVAKGGSHHISNLTTACMKCNQEKGTGQAGPIRKTAALSLGIVGKFIHTVREDGFLSYQGQIIDIDGETVIVQWFSYLSGDPTDIETLDKDFLYDRSKCRIYATESAWLDASRANCERMRAIPYEEHVAM